ncbi:MAG TPA: type IV secretory system conjugative DNA transfer family protein [Acidimicrobiales bacterium]|nr:type IV secretory system conjugative DNA transfer family protein [Acidimicrobiales bacterium]
MTAHLSLVLAAGAVGVVLVSGGLGRRRHGEPTVGAAPNRRTGAGRSRANRAKAATGAPGGGLLRSFFLPPHAEVADGGARWARHADLRPLVCAGLAPGRLVLGDEVGRGLGRQVLAAEPAQSVAVIGPTQSGKTTALAIPAILGWRGPVLAASVKTDLVRDTLEWRRRCGTVWCFDPAGTTGLPRNIWSPVSAARTWPLARRVAADLTEVSRGEGTTADGEFWYATAAKLLAPLLFAAASAGRTMQDVVRWVDTQETEEVLDALHAAGVPEALQAARATWLRDERQRSAVYTTAETVLEPFAEPDVADHAEGAVDFQPDHTPPYGLPSAGVRAAPWTAGEIDSEALLRGQHTLYICAPAHDQQRLRALFAALVSQVVHAAFAAAARAGRPLDPPLLVVLDEAANIAPLKELDGLAATCAGHGVQLVTVWQDLAQVRARYGERAATVVNNHRAKLFLPGIADPGTLDFASHLAGDQELPTPSVTVGARGERTVTTSPQVRRLLPPDTLRRLPKGSAVLLYGALPPARLRLRPWFSNAELAERGGSGQPGERQAGPKKWRRGSRSRREKARNAALQSKP